MNDNTILLVEDDALIATSETMLLDRQRYGVISVLPRAADGCVTLQVEDDGNGLPDGFDLARSTSLGLTLVMSLTGQVQGSFHIEQGEGTRCIVEFPV